MVDGALVWPIYWKVIMPLFRPALAALAVLEFTFIYNDFFWALMLMKTAKRPITSALNNLKGEFFTDNNLSPRAPSSWPCPRSSSTSLLQKQFISGLTLGSTKGYARRSARPAAGPSWTRSTDPVTSWRPTTPMRGSMGYDIQHVAVTGGELFSTRRDGDGPPAVSCTWARGSAPR